MIIVIAPQGRVNAGGFGQIRVEHCAWQSAAQCKFETGRVVADAVAWAEQRCDAAPIALGHMKQLLRSAPEFTGKAK